MTRKFLAFDIETATDVPGDDFNWRPFRPLGISCAATLSTEDEAPKLWHGGQDVSTPTSKMERQEAANLVDYLVAMAKSGFTIVTKTRSSENSEDIFNFAPWRDKLSCTRFVQCF